ncbi:MAG: O-antigen ligase family protein [Candidatus Promineifilaceae bacterium]|nr:O-antigen ligase family protein [Candidatus Promineifilaceae bacterium]
MADQPNQSLIDRLSRTVVKYEWLALVLLLPWFVFPRPLTSLLALIIPLIWLARWRSTGHFVGPTPADGAILLLAIMLLVSLYATFDLSYSVPRVLAIIYGVAVYYAAVEFVGRSRRHLFWGVAGLLFCGLTVAVLALFGTRWSLSLPLPPGLAELRAQLLRFAAAPAGFNPNQVAGTLLWVLPPYLALTGAALLALRMGTATRPRALLLSIGSLLVLGVFLLTQSRSGFVGLAVACLLMLLLARRRWLSPWRIGAAALVALLLVFVVWRWLPTPGLVEDPWASPVALADEVLEPTLQQALGGRIAIWSRALYGLQDFPLTGMGVGTFRRVVPLLYPLFTVSPSTDIGHAHNHLLQTGLDLGLPGLIAYLALWLFVGMMLWRSWRFRQDRWHRALIVGFAGALVGYFVYGLTDAVALGAKPGFIWWLELGLVAGLYRRLSPA